MLTIKIIVVDRTRAAFLEQGEAFYLKRLKRYARVEWESVRPARIRKGSPARIVLAEEGKAIARRIGDREYVVALDRGGKSRSSRELASRIERVSMSHPRLTFIIGGPLGLSETILERADEILSLSRLTLTHEMSRLFLLEQIYRSFTILRGEKYHK